jgi:hypothetical protein
LANDDAQDMLSSLKAFPVLNKAASIDSLTDALFAVIGSLGGVQRQDRHR